MSIVRVRIRVLVVAFAAVAVLGACGGGDDSGDNTDNTDGGNSSEISGDDDTTVAPAPPDDDDRADKDDGGPRRCVGDRKGAVTLEQGADTDLPGGSTASVDSTDVTADPPTATLAFGKATEIERQNATGLTVGDRFGLERGFYKVVGICSDSVALDEF